MNARAALRRLTPLFVSTAVACGGASGAEPTDGGGTSGGSSSGTGSSSGSGSTAGSGASSGNTTSGSSAPVDAATEAASSGTVGPSDASVDAPAVCFGDAGKLVRDGKVCYAVDSECTLLHVYTCCGPDLAIGLSTSRPQYAACYPQAIGAGSCGQLGCAKQLATVTEDGDSTANGGTPVARCVVGAAGGQCMTQIARPPAPGDAGGAACPAMQPSAPSPCPPAITSYCSYAATSTICACGIEGGFPGSAQQYLWGCGKAPGGGCPATPPTGGSACTTSGMRCSYDFRSCAAADPSAFVCQGGAWTMMLKACG